ncbi:MAG: PilZ domain-containing protein [Pirellulales bacterium]|nr:PilZ domain-containing protein [Pirellulales bacterium]
MTETAPGSSDRPLRRYFLLVCPEARREGYRAALADAPCEVAILTTIDEMLTCCVKEPPLALMLDMTMVTRAGSRALAPIFELRMGWPIMRCSLLPGGQLNGLCMDPQEHGPLLEMLRAIASDDEKWQIRPGTARWRRRHLRVEMQCRVRWRPVNSPDWQPGNTLDVGAGGLFITTYEDVAVDTPIEVMLLDLTTEPLTMAGAVVGRRRWEDGRDLPGMSVAFDAPTVPPEFKEALARSISLADLF